MPSANPAPRVWPPPEAEAWSPAERELLARLRPEALPRHVAIIMDGNGRWAKQRGFLERIRGHEAGTDSVREATRSCAVLRLEALTLYAFSSENWNRPKRETSALMALLERYLVQERPELMDNGVRLLAIGNIKELPASVQSTLAETIKLTENNRGLKLVLALSYGSRDEIVRAFRTAALRAAAGKLDPSKIDDAYVASLLDTAGLPDPDLLVRTSGEFRVSNFLLWQIAYTELHVTPALWPDFRRPHLLEALIEYQKRERRFGGLGADAPAREAP